MAWCATLLVVFGYCENNFAFVMVATIFGSCISRKYNPEEPETLSRILEAVGTLG